MSFKIKVLPELDVIGYQYNVASMDNNPDYFKVLYNKINEENKIDKLKKFNQSESFKGNVVITTNFRENDFDYVFGVIREGISDGLELLKIPSGTYIEIKASFETLEETWKEIKSGLITEAGYTDANEISFEYFADDGSVYIYVKVIEEEQVIEVFQEVLIDTSIDHLFNNFYSPEAYNFWSSAFDGEYSYEGLIGPGENILFHVNIEDDEFDLYAQITEFIENDTIKFTYYEEDLNSDLSIYFEKFKFVKIDEKHTKLIVSYNDIESFISDHELMWNNAFKLIKEYFKINNN